MIGYQFDMTAFAQTLRHLADAIEGGRVLIGGVELAGSEVEPRGVITNLKVEFLRGAEPLEPYWRGFIQGVS